MWVSKKTDYALRVLFTLVDHFGGTPIPIRELARRNDVPKRFLEQIMLDCKSQGWVDSVAGIRGGYLLAKKSGQDHDGRGGASFRWHFSTN
jgi:Rrf2 family protein